MGRIPQYRRRQPGAGHTPHQSTARQPPQNPLGHLIGDPWSTGGGICRVMKQPVEDTAERLGASGVIPPLNVTVVCVVSVWHATLEMQHS